jgi:hypothetical protein
MEVIRGDAAKIQIIKIANAPVGASTPWSELATYAHIT